MERIVKLFSLFILVLFLMGNSVFAEDYAPNALGVPVNITLPQCIKTFNVNYEKLFFLTEASIVQNNFEIEELQSKGGYIVFCVSQYKFLATIFTFGENKAILKITPCNNNYMFPPLIIRNIFRYIELNQYKKF